MRGRLVAARKGIVYIGHGTSCRRRSEERGVCQWTCCAVQSLSKRVTFAIPKAGRQAGMNWYSVLLADADFQMTANLLWHHLNL